MEWSRPVIEGEGVGVRTRHTAVAVHSDFDEYDRGKEFPGMFCGMCVPTAIGDSAVLVPYHVVACCGTVNIVVAWPAV